MITIEQIENEIRNVIAHGNNRSDVSFLADLYICQSAMNGKDFTQISTSNESEFAQCVNGKCFEEIMPILEELLDAVRVINPRLYTSFISKLR